MKRAAAVAIRRTEDPKGFCAPMGVLISGTLIFVLLWGLLWTTPAAAESVSRAALEPAPVEFSPSPLQDLLAVPEPGIAWRPESGDEALVAAVALGNDPELERLDPFRRRRLDLFRAEQPLAIGRAEMVLRLRLRANLRETMSVELHF